MRGMMAIVAGLLAMQASSAPVPKLSAGQTEQVVELRPLIDMPEGIAVDHRGNIFVSNRRLENDSRVCEILKIALDGTVTVVATVDPGVEDSFDRGIAGLAINSQDEVFAALISHHADTHGVWRLRRDGSLHRLPRSQRMYAPNAMTFGRQGHLYVTDGDTVWRFPRGGGPGAPWIRDDLLTGSNGIAFVPPRSLFVANTFFGYIAKIDIKPDGTAGQPEVVAMGPELLIIDGLAADVHGGLHGVIAGASILGTAPVVHIDPRTGAITSSTDEWDQFDFPTSLAFGRGPLDHKSVFVVNAGLFPENRSDAAPGVVRVSVDTDVPLDERQGSRFEQSEVE